MLFSLIKYGGLFYYKFYKNLAKFTALLCLINTA
ncbi:unknown [[Mannheimia] succiniciproducens MBEL55E]|uniref:Uncharacterized protein n=1 Tax=Mannheimia succiniciproducens (strain KCTC 0769BP / MBEL55E) TaxID=221988 RepID=Q65TF6_MANSM|nr:unknown [[Mannheimia] succiniciproducens MBEL55E]